ncbi:hypothetical protein ACIOKD_16630 [Streptomyces sp. NPDC087844]|uniref:hypothetical protein n=1 Tax=Streptomyces sp. NPDC087844 TaxID=3365805 RepID=UPI00381F7F28
MSSPGLPQDSGSALGHLRPAASSVQLGPKQEKFRSYMDHSMECADCDYGNLRCSVAQEIWAEWKALDQ